MPALLETGERRLGRQRGIAVGNTPHRELKPGIVAERVRVRSVFVPARNLIRTLPQKIESRVLDLRRIAPVPERGGQALGDPELLIEPTYQHETDIGAD